MALKDSIATDYVRILDMVEELTSAEIADLIFKINCSILGGSVCDVYEHMRFNSFMANSRKQIKIWVVNERWKKKDVAYHLPKEKNKTTVIGGPAGLGISLRQKIANLKEKIIDDDVEYLESGVYVIKSGDLYKIGMSTNVAKRIRSHWHSNPQLEVIALLMSDDPGKLESLMHKRFTERRVTGEWFQLIPEDIKEIKSMANTYN